MAVEANGGVNILNVRAWTVRVGNSSGVGHLSAWGIVIDDCSNGVWLAIGESDGKGHSFVALIPGIGGLLYGLGDFNNNG